MRSTATVERALRRLPLPRALRRPAGAAWRRVTSTRGAARRAAVEARLAGLDAKVAELEEQLDHERLYPCEWAYRRVQHAFGDAVTAGPLAGLSYPEWGPFRAEAWGPKILGTYEQEVHAALESLLGAAPATVINVGAAEGYYAVGLARRLPAATVWAFDLNADTHPLLASLAERNHVADRLRIGGECTLASLAALGSGALIVIDCEGAEADLLDPEAVPELQAASILVETHELARPGVSDLLVDRFSATHEVERVDSERRWVKDRPDLAFLPIVTQQLCIQEFREGPQHWLVMRPRAETLDRIAKEQGSAALRRVFSEIYATATWTDGIPGMPRSGRGALYERSEPVARLIAELAGSGEVRSVVDIGCGDLEWMSGVDPVTSGALDYLGVDIVPWLITEHRRLGWGRFEVGDVSAPGFRADGDLVLVKDTLFHLDDAHIAAALRNLAESTWKYLLITCSDTPTNEDRRFDRWHFAPLDVTLPPYSLTPWRRLPRIDGGCFAVFRPDAFGP